MKASRIATACCRPQGRSLATGVASRAFEAMRTVLALVAIAVVGRTSVAASSGSEALVEQAAHGAGESDRRRRGLEAARRTDAPSTIEHIVTYGPPRTATTLQTFAVRAIVCAARAERAIVEKYHHPRSLDTFKAHVAEHPTWRRFATAASTDRAGARGGRKHRDMFAAAGGGAGAGPPAGAWKKAARGLERDWNITAGSLKYVQLTAAVGIRDWKIVEDYRPFFKITDDEFADVVQYVRLWDVLRRCCGPQMSEDYRARLYGNATYSPHRRPGSVDYDSCEMYDLDVVEKLLVGNPLFRRCPELQTVEYRPPKSRKTWTTLNGTFCRTYERAAVEARAQFNDRLWQLPSTGRGGRAADRRGPRPRKDRGGAPAGV